MFQLPLGRACVLLLTLDRPCNLDAMEICKHRPEGVRRQQTRPVNVSRDARHLTPCRLSRRPSVGKKSRELMALVASDWSALERRSEGSPARKANAGRRLERLVSWHGGPGEAQRME